MQDKRQSAHILWILWPRDNTIPSDQRTLLTVIMLQYYLVIYAAHDKCHFWPGTRSNAPRPIPMPTNPINEFENSVKPFTVITSPALLLAALFQFASPRLII